MLDCIDHQHPQGKIRNKGVKKLPDYFSDIRSPILRDDLRPIRLGHLSLGCICINVHVVSSYLKKYVYLGNIFLAQMEQYYQAIERFSDAFWPMMEAGELLT